MVFPDVRSSARCALFIFGVLTLPGQASLAQVVLGPVVPLSNAVVNQLGQGGVTLARADNGISLAVWSDDRTGDHDVYGALLDPSGVLLTPQGGFKIVGSAGTHEGDPRVAACGNTFLVVWGDGHSSDIPLSSITDIFATRLDTAGLVLDPTPIVISNQPGIQHNVRGVASDGADVFLVPFRDAAASGSGEIRTMRLSASTGLALDPAGGVILEPDDGGLLKKNPWVSFGGGQFFVTWDYWNAGCPYPGEAGCVDIHGAFVDPTTGSMSTAFPTTLAFSCQEGSVSVFDGANFFVFHSDERLTNCVTADLTGERVTPLGVVLDPVDPTGLIGGIEISMDPPGFPGTRQQGARTVIDECGILITHNDDAGTGAGVALRMKRLDSDLGLRDGLTPDDFGLLIDQGPASPGVFNRAEPVVLATNSYLIAYTLGNVPLVRTATFEVCGPCMEIDVKSVLCELSHDPTDPADPPGLTGNVSVTFCVTNTSNVTAHYIVLPFAAALDHIIPLDPALDPGETGCVTVAINMPPEVSAVFPIVLADLNLEECCAGEMGVSAPECDCLQVTSSSLTFDATGTIGTLSFTFDNLTPDIIEHLLILPDPFDPLVNITPDWFPLGAVPGYSSSSGTINATVDLGFSPVPGSTVCFRISIHTAAFIECCSKVVCFVIDETTGGESNCCACPHGPGCDDSGCQDAVCAIDAFCCNEQWDCLCVDEAADLCGDLCPQGVSPGPGDVNGDGVVDGADLGVLLGNWGDSGAGDLNHDGVVDGADLGILLGGFG